MTIRPTRSLLTLCSLALILAGPLTAQAELFAKKAEALPMMELQPELDYTRPEDATYTPTESAKEPIRAKAVVVDINSDALNYDKDRDVYIATGGVHIVISEQNSELFADKVTYDQNQDLLIAEDNVVIIKNGQRTDGTYAKISLTQESALINDFTTAVEQVRIKAKTAFLDNNFQQYENGRLIISSKMLENSRTKGRKSSSPKARPDDETLGNLASNAAFNQGGGVPAQQQGVMGEDVPDSKFKMHVKEIEVHREEDGYDKIYMKWPSLSYGKFKLGTMPSTEFSYDEKFQEVDYLGPDIGYDPDLGGAFAGPGWDFQLGRGSVRFSPIVSYGGGGRKSRDGGRYEDLGVGAGLGGVAHYRDHYTKVDLAYNSRVGQPVAFLERRLLDGKTKVVGSMNEDYNEGFLGYERPGFGLMVNDTRHLKDFANEKFGLYSYESLGFFKDEFFPLNQTSNFVQADANATPGMAGRAQWQLDLRNREPLLRVGENLTFGFRANAGMAGYSTGDFVGIVRGGPNMDFYLGDRFHSKVQYYMAATAGDTPFIFDTYYRGRQNVRIQNDFMVNDYLSVGLRNDISLLRDNDKNSMFTGNMLYMMVGPKSVKFNLAYDVVRKRSYFGVKFYPGSGGRAIDYDTLKVFQPENYGATAW